MSADADDPRIAALEARVARIEERFATSNRPAPKDWLRPNAPPPPAPPPIPAVMVDGPRIIGSILGWGGAFALVLAASYLIRLAIDNGWLNPLRQVALAAISGLLLIVAGFGLRKDDRRYAGLLPAAGIATLFLAIYGGHLYHHVIGAREAGVAILVVCAASLWLCRAFGSDLYALFAVAGSYSAPLLLQTGAGTITDLAIYFTAWSVVFSVFATWHGRRLIYLLAMYLALVCFDMAWRSHGAEPWTAVLAFQTAQFLVFGIATVAFSIRHATPLDERGGLAHLPPLLLFYSLQYTVLRPQLPSLAPWIALASLAAIGLLYRVARHRTARALPGGELLLSCYAALVLLHAGYMESVPKIWAPWFAIALMPVVATVAMRLAAAPASRWPIWIAAAIIFLENYLRVSFNTELESVAAAPLLPVAYALLLYAGYWWSRRADALKTVKPLLLCMGHISAMAAALRLLNESILGSAGWGLLAVGCLLLSLRFSDRLLGRSAVALFAAAALKVLLLDLSGASPVARIIGLIVLGGALYAGGLLYQRLLRDTTPTHER